MYRYRLTYRLFFYESYECRSLNFYWLAVSVVEGEYEVEKVALPEVAGRLLLEMRSPQTRTVNNKKTGAINIIS